MFRRHHTERPHTCSEFRRVCILDDKELRIIKTGKCQVHDVRPEFHQNVSISGHVVRSVPLENSKTIGRYHGRISPCWTPGKGIPIIRNGKTHMDY